jgi:hypothetical protein
MKNLLLLGAGFSRNWGGWLAAEAFEYLVGCPEIVANRPVTELLWRHKDGGGFEAVLAEVRQAWKKAPHKEQPSLDAIQGAIGRMFEDMNRGFFALPRFEFQQAMARMVRQALVRFDAIFTLNQDLLLEHWYLADRHDVSVMSAQRWSEGCTLPGLRPVPNQARADLASLARNDFVPDNLPFRVDERTQPYFKLHGSCNWNEAHGGPLMIMGANKVENMKAFPILLRYQEAFAHYLMGEPGSRLMVIGYSFRDDHINQIIFDAVHQAGLKMFIIDPAGANVARNANPTRAPAGARAAAPQESELEAIFKASVIGASRRSLGEIFGADEVEHAKVMRFLV